MAQTAGNLPESDTSTIGYPSVEAALRALREKPEVTFRTENGWLIAEDRREFTIWSFAPEGHPSHPTAVKRSVVVRDDNTHVEMSIRCEADKISCDNILLQFQAINGRFADIAVEPLGNGRYELSLASETILGIEEAQALLLPKAAELCEGSRPVLGRYRFASTEPIEQVAEEPSSFTFIQELECSAPSPSAADVATSPTLGSTAEAEEVKNTVRAMSIEYFEDIANERYEKAYAVVDAGLRGLSTPESWEAEKRSFRSDVGVPVKLQIARLTLYDNPPGAPQPGLYVAADFNNEYEEAPIHCGYLMWLRIEEGAFRIVREESGHVTSEQLLSMPDNQLSTIRQRFGCVALQRD
ncbi:MAG TPA: DUF4019 domain-containing protein [Gammaproteobacteria bacterium]